MKLKEISESSAAMDALPLSMGLTNTGCEVSSKGALAAYPADHHALHDPWTAIDQIPRPVTR
jgi:hypothetical protein